MVSCGSISVGDADPDPIVTDCTVSPTDPTPDEPVTIRATVENDNDRSGTAYVQFYVDGSLIAEREVSMPSSVGDPRQRTVQFSPSSRGFSPGQTFSVSVDVSLSRASTAPAPKRTTPERVVMGAPASGCGTCGGRGSLAIQKGLRRLRTARLR